LVRAGARHFYISNLPLSRAQTVLASILDKAGLPQAPFEDRRPKEWPSRQS
jgi:hypothetical protein